MQHSRKQATAKGPAEWFTGEVWVDSIAQGHGSSPFGVAFVRFSPGARTAWHSHSVGQTLYVTDGEGRAQALGGPVVALRAGDVVTTPAGELHWHGAAPEHFMAHLAVSEGTTKWGDHVSDDEYNAGAASS